MTWAGHAEDQSLRHTEVAELSSSPNMSVSAAGVPKLTAVASASGSLSRGSSPALPLLWLLVLESLDFGGHPSLPVNPCPAIVKIGKGHGAGAHLLLFLFNLLSLSASHPVWSRKDCSSQ